MSSIRTMHEQEAKLVYHEIRSFGRRELLRVSLSAMDHANRQIPGSEWRLSALLQA